METSYARSLREQGQPIFTETTESLYLVRPTLTILDAVIDIALEHDTPTIHVLSPSSDLRELRRTFHLSTFVAEAREQERLTLTPRAPAGQGTIFVTNQSVYAIDCIDEHNLVFETTTDSERLIEHCREYVSEEPFDLRTPRWSAVTDTLADQFGNGFKAEFVTAIDTVASQPEQDVVDEVTISLLIGARHETELYELSRWAEDAGVCSRGSVSRVKTTLVEQGVLETEKVHMDVGRPRQRILLSETYQSMGIDELIREVEPRQVA